VSAPLFLVAALPDGDTGVLDGPEGHHAATVQRLRAGEELLLADGRGGTATAVVTAVGRGRLELTVTSRRYAHRPTPRLVVAQGIAKGDRGELAVQAMTEVGVDEIVPWAAERSVVRWRGERGDRAREKWAATAREAAKQARRPWLPTVAGTPDESTPALVRRAATAALALVLHEEATTRLSTLDLPAPVGTTGADRPAPDVSAADVSAADVPGAGGGGADGPGAGCGGADGPATGGWAADGPAADRPATDGSGAGVDILLVVGPEGGISPTELAALTDAGAVPVRLGAEVLRTSTAGVAALSVLSARLGRW
jgi:16S rRNA (uracil1498-N3)-methyltransferase